MMKNLILALICQIFFLLPSISAQTVNGRSIADLDISYIEITETLTNFGKRSFKIDFGSESIRNEQGMYIIKTNNGEVVKFKSIAEILNFFSKLGFELFTNTRTYPRCLLRKAVK